MSEEGGRVSRGEDGKKVCYRDNHKLKKTTINLKDDLFLVEIPQF